MLHKLFIFLKHYGSSKITVIYTRTWEGMVLSKGHYSEEISELRAIAPRYDILDE